MKYRWVRSMFTIFLSPCPLWRSISTVDRFILVWGHIDGRYRPIFFGMNPYRRSISTDFWKKSTVDHISTVFSSRRILIDRRYRPYSQVGESLSTVDIDRDRSTGRLKSNRPIDRRHLWDFGRILFFLVPNVQNTSRCALEKVLSVLHSFSNVRCVVVFDAAHTRVGCNIHHGHGYWRWRQSGGSRSAEKNNQESVYSCAVLCYVQCYNVLCYAVLCCAVLCCAVLWYNVAWCVVHCAVLIMGGSWGVARLMFKMCESMLVFVCVCMHARKIFSFDNRRHAGGHAARCATSSEITAEASCQASGKGGRGMQDTTLPQALSMDLDMVDIEAPPPPGSALDRKIMSCPPNLSTACSL